MRKNCTHQELHIWHRQICLILLVRILVIHGIWVFVKMTMRSNKSSGGILVPRCLYKTINTEYIYWKHLTFSLYFWPILCTIEYLELSISCWNIDNRWYRIGALSLMRAALASGIKFAYLDTPFLSEWHQGIVETSASGQNALPPPAQSSCHS